MVLVAGLIATPFLAQPNRNNNIQPPPAIAQQQPPQQIVRYETASFLTGFEIELDAAQKEAFLKAFLESNTEHAIAKNSMMLEMARSMPSAMKHRPDGSLVVVYIPSQPQLYLLNSQGPVFVHLYLNPSSKRGVLHFDGALGTKEEFAVALRELKNPFKRLLMELVGAPEVTPEMIESVEQSWNQQVSDAKKAQERFPKFEPNFGVQHSEMLDTLPRRTTSVDTSQFDVASATDERTNLETDAVLQCIVVTLWDPEHQVGGMSHFWFLRDPGPGMGRFLARFQEKGGTLGPQTKIRLRGGRQGESETLLSSLLVLLEGKGTIVEQDVLKDDEAPVVHMLLDVKTGNVVDLIDGFATLEDAGIFADRLQELMQQRLEAFLKFHGDKTERLLAVTADQQLEWAKKRYNTYIITNQQALIELRQLWSSFYIRDVDQKIRTAKSSELGWASSPFSSASHELSSHRELISRLFGNPVNFEKLEITFELPPGEGQAYWEWVQRQEQEVLYISQLLYMSSWQGVMPDRIKIPRIETNPEFGIAIALQTELRQGYLVVVDLDSLTDAQYQQIKSARATIHQRSERHNIRLLFLGQPREKAGFRDDFLENDTIRALDADTLATEFGRIRGLTRVTFFGSENAALPIQTAVEKLGVTFEQKEFSVLNLLRGFGVNAIMLDILENGLEEAASLGKQA